MPPWSIFCLCFPCLCMYNSRNETVLSPQTILEHIPVTLPKIEGLQVALRTCLGLLFGKKKKKFIWGSWHIQNGNKRLDWVSWQHSWVHNRGNIKTSPKGWSFIRIFCFLDGSKDLKKVNYLIAFWCWLRWSDDLIVYMHDTYIMEWVRKQRYYLSLLTSTFCFFVKYQTWS